MKKRAAFQGELHSIDLFDFGFAIQGVTLLPRNSFKKSFGAVRLYKHWALCKIVDSLADKSSRPVQCYDSLRWNVTPVPLVAGD
jgi:hypothetical protein